MRLLIKQLEPKSMIFRPDLLGCIYNLVYLLQKHIFWLKIGMDDLVFVQEVHAIEQLQTEPTDKV
jgi:hypothetical protein